MSCIPDKPLTVESVCSPFAPPADVAKFAHTPGTEVVFGEGVTDAVGEIAAKISSGPWLIVTDPGITSAGHTERVKRLLESAGCLVTIYDCVRENPTTKDVAACVEAARSGSVKAIVGLGGGSSMDTAKGCNFLLTNGGEMRDYWGVGKAEKEMLPLIAIPTTAGTGSECQSFALIADAETHQKMACGDKKAAARVALLDPLLTVTQPVAVTAHTGIDALAHAIETAVTKKGNETSFAYAKLAFQLLDRSLEAVFSNPRDLGARADVQLAAAYAGTAIENSMLGAAHSAANPLTAHHGTIHGLAVGVMLPHVIRLNREDAASAGRYKRLFSGDLATRVEEILGAAGMMQSLRELGVTKDGIPTLAAEAATQWTAQFNPVEVDQAVFSDLYAAAL